MHGLNFIHHDHDISLIIISVLIAAFASYTALDMITAMNANRREVKKVWIFGGALGMGLAISVPTNTKEYSDVMKEGSRPRSIVVWELDFI